MDGPSPLRRAGSRAWLVLRTAISGLMADRGTMLAAAISYHVLFSLLPLTLGVLAIAAFVLRDPSTRDHLVTTITQALPGDTSPDAGQQGSIGESVKTVIDKSSGVAAPAALIAIPGLIWAGSGMMGAIRTAVDAALGDGRSGHSFVVGKLIDIALVFAVGAFLMASLAITVVQTQATHLREAASDWSSPLPTVVDALATNVVPVFVVLVSLLAFVALYRLVPRSPAHGGALAVGALFATVLFEVLRRGFAFYVTTFANYSTVYGPLGTIIAFLFFIYVAAVILIFGAELAAAWRDTDGGRHGSGREAEHGLPLGHPPVRRHLQREPRARAERRPGAALVLWSTLLGFLLARQLRRRR